MNKEFTPFGKYFSSLRKERKQTINEAAKLLSVSISYISSVEHGDREIPNDWKAKIIAVYKLNRKEQSQLNDAYYSTPSKKKITLLEIENSMTNLIENLAENDGQKKKMLNELKNRLKKLR